MKSPYDVRYYEELHSYQHRSPEEVVPSLLEMIHPKSVIDVGCGAGGWLQAFIEYGIEDVWGIDGDWVKPEMLQFPKERFTASDLTKPFGLNRQFDLVLCLEVAEHLPAERAEAFVDSLTSLGRVILFSAAIPFQGGVNHANLQWPDYWAEFFRRKGYVAVDCVRKRIWQRDNVAVWYSQNMLVFASRDRLSDHPSLAEAWHATAATQLSVVHPRMYLAAIQERVREETALRQELASTHKAAADLNATLAVERGQFTAREVELLARIQETSQELATARVRLLDPDAVRWRTLLYYAITRFPLRYYASVVVARVRSLFLPISESRS